MRGFPLRLFRMINLHAERSGFFLNIIIKGLINTLEKKKGVFGSFLFSCLLITVYCRGVVAVVVVCCCCFWGCWHIFNIKSVIDGCKMED